MGLEELLREDAMDGIRRSGLAIDHSFMCDPGPCRLPEHAELWQEDPCSAG